MSDQAEGLRRRIEAQRGRAPGPGPAGGPPEPPPPSPCRSLLLTSGKGGVGTSNLALNLAIALGERGRRVVLVDADLGLANIDLLCGLSPGRDLGDVLAGDCSLDEATVEGPRGIRVVPGAHATRTLGELLAEAPGRLLVELARLAGDADFLVVDAGSGLGPAILALAAASDEVLVVATPEPTAMLDAHATIARLRRLPSAPTIRAVVNQAASAREGAATLASLVGTARQFLGAGVDGLGSVRADPSVPLAVRARRPFATTYPGGPAARDVRRLALALMARAAPAAPGRKPGFLAGLVARLALARAAAL